MKLILKMPIHDETFYSMVAALDLSTARKYEINKGVLGQERGVSSNNFLEVLPKTSTFDTLN